LITVEYLTLEHSTKFKAEGATPRKLSGKRTVKIITLESRRKPHRRSKTLRYHRQIGKIERVIMEVQKTAYIIIIKI